MPTRRPDSFSWRQYERDETDGNGNARVFQPTIVDRMLERAHSRFPSVNGELRKPQYAVADENEIEAGNGYADRATEFLVERDEHPSIVRQSDLNRCDLHRICSLQAESSLEE